MRAHRTIVNTMWVLFDDVFKACDGSLFQQHYKYKDINRPYTVCEKVDHILLYFNLFSHFPWVMVNRLNFPKAIIDDSLEYFFCIQDTWRARSKYSSWKPISPIWFNLIILPKFLILDLQSI